MSDDPTPTSAACRFVVDAFGVMRRAHVVTDMASPVECAHCGRTYDLGTITVTGRYADCSVWRSPCCGRTVDSRGRDYYDIDKTTGAVVYR